MSGLYCMPTTECECSLKCTDQRRTADFKQDNIFSSHSALSCGHYTDVRQRCQVQTIPNFKSQYVCWQNERPISLFLPKLISSNYIKSQLAICIWAKCTLDWFYVGLLKARDLLSKVCSTVNEWCTVINQIWMITDLGPWLWEQTLILALLAWLHVCHIRCSKYC